MKVIHNITPEMLTDLLKMIDSSVINQRIAKEVFEEMFYTGKTSKQIVDEKGLSQISDEGAIKEFIQQTIIANPKAVSDYLLGKNQAIKFLLGQIIKLSKGRANPTVAYKLLIEKLRSYICTEIELGDSTTITE